MSDKKSVHGLWSSRWVFVLAATGSAVGLGNIWRFPYITGENGGGAFVLVYLACVVLVGLPIMIAEIIVGRRGRQSPINSMRSLAAEEGLSRRWALVGAMGIVAGFLILSFYSVVAGWSISYIFSIGAGRFAGATIESAELAFEDLISSPFHLLFWHTVFLTLTAFIVGRGVQKGLEKAIKILMPILFFILLLMVFYAAFSGDFRGALQYLFKADFSKLTGDVILIAFGQAFFSLSLGMGSIMIYGAYLAKDVSIPKMALVVGGADTLVALLAGLAIFPIVFGFGLAPGQGPGLVFVSLAISFGHMPWGSFFGALFFILLSIAAWTSAISLLEPVTAWLVEKFKWSRPKASAIAGGLAWFLGVGSVLSFNEWEDFVVGGRNYFEWMEFSSTTILLPLGGMFVAIFASMKLANRSVQSEFGLEHPMSYRIWKWSSTYFAPVAVALVLLEGIDLGGVVEYLHKISAENILGLPV